MARCPAGHESEASDYCDTCGLVIAAESAGAGASVASVPAAAAVTATAPRPAAAPSGSGGGCPVCQAERNGRFCEECGYDFDLAEAMPEVTVAPGVPPAGQQPAPEPDEPDSGAGSQGQDRGLDLDAEIARAEAEAAAGAPEAVPSPEAPSTTEIEEAEAEAETESEPGTAVSLASVLSPTAALTAELTLLVNADRDYYKAQIERGDIIESEFPFPKYPHERRFTFDQSPIRVGRASSSRGLAPEIDLTGPPLDPAVSHLHAQLLRHEEGWVVVDLGSANGTRLNEAEEPLEAETEIPVNRGDRIHLGVWTTITIQ
ncbi:FHA domain-containing protein [Actinospica sp.]|uniref:FHA domain-containing protein n=1 Tax=Actinospica sp. TaxID=1872142 RepID=UPI002C2D58C7|nr:FHA domain-containing protein [Actinospica sp.]HWG27729.1 FHA domain-containing protein [Actinospica sp.]